MNTFDTLKQELNKKDNEIAQKNIQLEKQNELIKELIKELKNNNNNDDNCNYNFNDSKEINGNSLNIININSQSDIINDKI